jgi:hypothetical protein
MKTLLILVTAAFIVIISGCNTSNNDSATNDTIKCLNKVDLLKIDTTLFLKKDTVLNRANTIKEDEDFMAKYICPNHCDGSGSSKPGECKKCGMELIENID